MLSIAGAVSGCSAAEGVAQRVRAWWDDEPAAAPAEVHGEDTPAEPPPVGSTSGATVGTGGHEPTSDSTTGLGASTGAEESTSTGLQGGSTTIPMSFARPPTSTGPEASGDTGGDDEGSTTGSEGSTTGEPETTGSSPAPTSGDLACVQGAWEVRDFSRYYQRVLRAQAHGRRVRHEGTTGTYTLHFDGARVRGEAEHLRLRFSTRLADREVRYRVDIHGEFDTTIRLEGADRLRIDPHTGDIEAKESAHFEGGKVQSRRPTLPTAGLHEFDCSATSLVLRPIEGGKAREPIRFARPGAPP